MKKFYISPVNSDSGVAKYAKDFYELILKDKEYIWIDSARELPDIMSAISSRDHVHIEIGIFQKREIEILMSMLRSNYGNVCITLHDAPLLKYPFYEFRNPFLNKVSKFYDKHINRFNESRTLLQKVQKIYVLSDKGLQVLKVQYSLNNIYYLPHVVNTKEIRRGSIKNYNFIYFGFIGKNKGIEYSLQLHQLMLAQKPEIVFYIIGRPIGKEKKFYDSLKAKYSKNVHYLGYVSETRLNEVFDKASFALLMFKDYKYFWPFSGSILYSLAKGKIVFTNKVNTIPEIISNNKNGFFLSGNLKEDCKILNRLIDDKELLEKINSGSYTYLLKNHSVETINEKFKD